MIPSMPNTFSRIDRIGAMVICDCVGRKSEREAKIEREGQGRRMGWREEREGSEREEREGQGKDGVESRGYANRRSKGRQPNGQAVFNSRCIGASPDERLTLCSLILRSPLGRVQPMWVDKQFVILRADRPTTSAVSHLYDPLVRATLVMIRIRNT